MQAISDAEKQAKLLKEEQRSVREAVNDNAKQTKMLVFDNDFFDGRKIWDAINDNASQTMIWYFDTLILWYYESAKDFWLRKNIGVGQLVVMTENVDFDDGNTKT